MLKKQNGAAKISIQLVTSYSIPIVNDDKKNAVIAMIITFKDLLK